MRQKDIAKILNISTSTVSRVLNNIPKAASKELSNEIWQLAHKNDYSFNNHAKLLRLGSPRQEKTIKKIACVYARSDSSSPFFSSLQRAFETEILKDGYSFHQTFPLKNVNKANFIAYLKETSLYPLLILGRIPEHLLATTNHINKPVIQVGINANCDLLTRVMCDGFEAASQIIRYLSFCGHKRIAYFGEIKNELRYYGYRDEIEVLGLPFQKQSCVFNCNLSMEGGYKACLKWINIREKSFFSAKTTAIFCANDETAIGAYKCLKDHNIKVPEDISIISIDNIEEAQCSSSLLTSMKIPITELGEIGAKVLLASISNQFNIPFKIELPCELIIRDSVIDFNNHSISELKEFNKSLKSSFLSDIDRNKNQNY